MKIVDACRVTDIYQISHSCVFSRKEILQEGTRYVRFSDGLEVQREKTWDTTVDGSMGGSM